MIRHFSTVDDLNNYILQSLYINKTTDPTNCKYLYNAFIRKISYYPNYNLDTMTLFVTAYSQRYLIKLCLSDVLPANSDPLFIKNSQKMLLGQLLNYEYNLEDATEQKKK